MTITVDANLDVFINGVNKGNFVDVLRSKPSLISASDEVEAKAALATAWIAKIEQVNDNKREIESIKTVLRDKVDAGEIKQDAAVAEALAD